MGGFVIVVIIVPQICHMHHAFYGIWQFHIHAPRCDAGNYALEGLPDALRHIFRLFQLVRFPFCFFGAPFPGAGLGGCFRQYFFIMGNPPFRHFPPQRFLDNPVDLQIRIPADGGGEMAVILGGKAEMPRVYGGVFCLLHGTEGKAAD